MRSLILSLILCATPDEAAIAIADHAAYAAKGEMTRYVIANEKEATVLSVLVPMTSRNPLLDHTKPKRIGTSRLLRLNLTSLKWSEHDWVAAFGLTKNPYTPFENPLIAPAGVAIEFLSDSTRSDSGDRLFFGGTAIPKTMADVWKAVQIDPDKQRGLAFGLVEGKSGVNVAANGARLLTFLDGTHVSAWETLDVKTVGPGTDPLEALIRAIFKEEAKPVSEVFILMPVRTLSGKSGVLPLTFLADGAGKLVNEAPPDIVLDTTHAGGFATIRNRISCLSCHAEGPRYPTENALRSLLESGVELKANSKELQEQIEIFHLADGEVKKALDAWKEGYATAIWELCGHTPAAWTKTYLEVVNSYRADVTLERAATELDSTAEELKLVIANGNNLGLVIGNRAAALARGKAMPRSQFDRDFLRLQALLVEWRKK